MSRGEGIGKAKLADLVDFELSPAFSELEKRALRYADALTQTPTEVPQDLFDSLREHFSPRQMVELTTAIAWENFRARFNRGFGIESEGFWTNGGNEGACPVHTAAGTASHHPS